DANPPREERPAGQQAAPKQRGDQHGVNDLAVRADLAVVEVEDRHGEDACAVVDLDRLDAPRQQTPRVACGQLEEAADRVTVAVPRNHGQIPSSRSTSAIVRTAVSRSPSVWAADTEMRRRERCLGTAG